MAALPLFFPEQRAKFSSLLQIVAKEMAKEKLQGPMREIGEAGGDCVSLCGRLVCLLMPVQGRVAWKLVVNVFMKSMKKILKD